MVKYKHAKVFLKTLKTTLLVKTTIKFEDENSKDHNTKLGYL